MNLRPLQYISIQTTSVCTSACQYCPYPYAATTQNPGYMSDELFEKIILDIKEISPNFDGHYSAQLGNEPAADPKFLERMEFVYKTFPNIRINFPSNAQLLDKERGRKLIDLMFKYENMVDDRNHGGILVHFAGISEDSWKDVMDSTQDYYKTIENIRNLISYNAELGRKYPNKACNINTHNWFEHPDPSQYLGIPMGITAYHKPENPELWPSLEKWEKLHNRKFQY